MQQDQKAAASAAASRPLPRILEDEASRAFERVKARMAPEDLALFEARPDFRTALGLSDFFSAALCAYPRECAALVRRGDADCPAYERAGGGREPIFEDADEFFSKHPSLADLKRSLRIFRRTRLAMLALRDLTGKAGIEEAFRTLSQTAEAVVLKTLDITRASLKTAFGDALDDDGTPMPLLTFGMGKLGGGELNFSSDLDLIFCYPHDGETTGGKASISFREFFQKIVTTSANLLSDLTADSFCYRIDLRLRPFGDAGALVNSFDALSNYYETQGRTWERYALVKARLLGGEERNGHYGEELITMLSPFVYRRYLDYGAIESLRKLKHMIESEVRRRSLVGNFKLGQGGIREIEFIAQVFELMRGGRIPALRERNLRRSLQIISEQKLLPEGVCAMLDKRYVFLRQLENRLQEQSDRQTQTLPDNPRDRARLVHSMGFDAGSEDGWEKLAGEVEAATSDVHGEFRKVVSAESEEHDQRTVKSDPLYDLLSDPTTPQAELAAAIMPDLKPWEGKADPKTDDSRSFDAKSLEKCASDLASEALKLTSTLSRLPVGPVGRDTLSRLLPKALHAVCRGTPPSAAAHALSGLATLISTVATRTTYLQLLNDNEGVLRRVIELINENAYATDLVTAHPILLDELIVPQYFTAPPKPQEYLAWLQERLLRIDPDDLEEQMEELRLFKKIMVFRVSMSDKSGHLPLMKVSDCLTFLAEAIVKQVLAIAWRYTVKSYGAPEGTSSDDPGLAVIGYGKLGGIELGYKSDLDMVFIRAVNDSDTKGERSVPCFTFYQRLVQKFLHICTTRTQGGVLYDLDMRLRPDGDSGLLITDLHGYEEYQKGRAWTWEHQALVRARPIAGSPSVIREFERIRDSVLRTPRDPAKLRDDVLAMRKKMRDHLDRGSATLFDLKQSPGGMVDIEFIAQYLLLREAPSHPDMVLWSDNVRILEECARIGAISEKDASALKEAYIAIRRWYHALSLADLKRILPRTHVPQECAGVIEIWNRIFG
jgi:glutamate-ammonia-ligase adenylyltransferase